jgi:hypothetical protein
MPYGDDHPSIIGQASKGYFLAHHPDPQKREVKAKKIVTQRYQPVSEKVMGQPDPQMNSSLSSESALKMLDFRSHKNKGGPIGVEGNPIIPKIPVQVH